MSKMSQTHAELSEQAYDLGYSSLEEAFNDGYESAYFCGDPVLFKRKHKSPEPLIHQPTLNKDLTNFEERLRGGGRMSKYKGLFTFDEDNHMYVPVAQADGIIDTMHYELDEAHREWEAEKAVVLGGLDKLYQWHLEQSPNVAPYDDLARLLHAIDFVKRSNL